MESPPRGARGAKTRNLLPRHPEKLLFFDNNFAAKERNEHIDRSLYCLFFALFVLFCGQFVFACGFAAPSFLRAPPSLAEILPSSGSAYWAFSAANSCEK
jgi:hypothetical protein